MIKKDRRISDNMSIRKEGLPMKKTISSLIVAGILFSGGTFNSVEAKTTFKDIKNHWAQGDIQNLAERKIMAGYEDGTFRPDKMITLSEFTSLLVRTLNLPPANGKYLPQPNTHWAASSLEAAIEEGVISLEEVQRIGLDTPIDREVMTTMLVKGLKLTPSDTPSPYTDINNAYVTKAFEEYLVRGYMMGSERQFKATDFTTRAQAAAVIKRIIDYKNDPERFKLEREQADAKMVEGETAISKWLQNLSESDKQKILNELKKHPSKIGYAGGKQSFDEAHRYSVEHWTVFSQEDINTFVETAKGYNEVRFNIDYRTIGEDFKNKLIKFFGGRLTYKGKSGLHPKEVADMIIQDVKKDKLIMEMHFVTDPSMFYMDKNNTVNVRGRQYFIIRSGQELAKSEGVQIGKWYYSDADVQLESFFTNIAIDWERPEYTFSSIKGLGPNIKLD